MIHHISFVVKKLLLVLWVCVLLGGLYMVVFHSDILTGAYLAEFLRSFGTYLLVVYFALSMLRGFTLVPSMPFVIAGVILFPTELMFVYTISLL